MLLGQKKRQLRCEPRNAMPSTPQRMPTLLRPAALQQSHGLQGLRRKA
jgi:hypothetical protein